MTATTLDRERETAAGDDAAAVRDTVRQAGTSFYWGMRLLPPAKREAVYAVYAFCRAVDDVADGPEAPTDKQARLDAWRAEVERLYAGRPQHAVTRVLARHLEPFDLPKAEFHAVIDGMECDARGGLIAPEMAALERYCRQVAGAVGVLSIQIFAQGDPAADPATRRQIAVAQGEALQFTNILRDQAADAAEDRLYLPDELLAEAGVASRDPGGVLADPNRLAACQALATRARERFREVRGLLAPLRAETARPCRLMLEIYAGVLQRLEAEGFPTDRRVALSKGRKAWIVLRYGLLAPAR